MVDLDIDFATIGHILLIVLGLALVYDFAYPRFIYPLKAKRAGTGLPVLNFSFPFGIYRGIKTIIDARNNKMLAYGLNLRDTPSGTVMSQIMGTTMVITRDSENIKTILSTKFADFGIGKRHAILSPMLGDGIFTSDGGHWKNSRAMLRPLFLRERVSKLEMIEKHVQSLCTVIDSWKGQYGDIQTQFRSLTLDTAIHFLFGVHLDNLLGHEHEFPLSDGTTVKASILGQSIMTATHYLGIRARLSGLYWLCYPKKFREALRICHGFADEVIRQARGRELGKDEYSFVSELGQYTSDTKLIRDQALSLFLAGRSTTASLLSHLCMHLSATNRWKTLREHVLRDIGPTAEGVTFEALKGCKYLQWCLNESLRVHPNLPVNMRQARKDVVLPRGGGKHGDEPLLIPKGMMVVFHIFAMHHDKEVWGEDADEFRPERWDNLKIPGWGYIPFLGGPRVCLGQQFALTEAGYVLTRLVQEYEELRGPGYDKYEFDLALTISIEPGVNVQFVRGSK